MKIPVIHFERMLKKRRIKNSMKKTKINADIKKPIKKEMTLHEELQMLRKDGRPHMLEYFAILLILIQSVLIFAIYNI